MKVWMICTSIFLSTLSLRRATRNIANSEREKNISIHALLAESDGRVNLLGFQAIISIHALLAESDFLFYNVYVRKEISIHALLAESDAYQ